MQLFLFASFFLLHMPGSLPQTPVFPILTIQFIKLSRCWPIVQMKFEHFLFCFDILVHCAILSMVVECVLPVNVHCAVLSSSKSSSKRSCAMNTNLGINWNPERKLDGLTYHESLWVDERQFSDDASRCCVSNLGLEWYDVGIGLDGGLQRRANADY